MKTFSNWLFKQGVRKIWRSNTLGGNVSSGCSSMYKWKSASTWETTRNWQPCSTDPHIRVKFTSVYAEDTKEIHLEEGNEYPTESCSLGLARAVGRIWGPSLWIVIPCIKEGVCFKFERVYRLHLQNISLRYVFDLLGYYTVHSVKWY